MTNRRSLSLGIPQIVLLLIALPATAEALEWQSSLLLKSHVVPSAFDERDEVVSGYDDRRIQLLVGVGLDLRGEAPLEGSLTLSPLGSLGAEYPEDERGIFRGWGAVDVEGRVRLVGEGGLVRDSGVWRLGVGPIVGAPLPGPDFGEESEDKSSGENYTKETVGLKAWAFGVGVRSGWNPGQHLELSNDIGLRWFLPADYGSSSLERYNRNALREALDGVEPYESIWYRYELSSRIGADYALPIEESVKFTLGANGSFTYRPEPVVDGETMVRDTDTFAGTVGGSAGFTFLLDDGTRLASAVSYSHVFFGKNAESIRSVGLSFTVGSMR